MERAAQALASKLVASHCRFGRVQEQRLSCVTGEVATCEALGCDADSQVKVKVRDTRDDRRETSVLPHIVAIAPLHRVRAASFSASESWHLNERPMSGAYHSRRRDAYSSLLTFIVDLPLVLASLFTASTDIGAGDFSLPPSCQMMRSTWSC